MKLMVLDGNSILNRAFYGVRLLSNREGLYTNAVYGFLSILFKLLDEHAPDALCVCFDLKEPTFRHLAYEGYKARRVGMPEELAVQVPVIKDVLDAMNIKRVELAGFEADDLIGTICDKCKKEKMGCDVVTGDRDSLQLVSGDTRVLLVSTVMGRTETKEYTESRVMDEYGLTPKQLIDLKGLMGDKSDDIPGVPGVGEKTALELMRRFGGIDAIYENIESPDIRGAVREKLKAGRDMAHLSRRLAEIECCAPVEFSPLEAKLKDPDRKRLYELFLRLEFKTFINRLGLSPQANINTPEASGFTALKAARVKGEKALTELTDALSREKEPAGIAWAPGLAALALCLKDKAYTVLRRENGQEEFDALLRAVFSDRVKKACHDLRPLMVTLIDEGLPMEGFSFDSSLGAYLLNPAENSYGIEKVALRFLNTELPSASLYNDENAFSELSDVKEAESSLAAHAQAARSLCLLMEPEIKKAGMDELYYTVELPLCRVLAEMQHTGFKVDRARLIEYQAKISQRMEACEKLIYEQAGESFNINSTKQLGEILFNKLGLPAVKKNKTGFSTDIEVLEKLKGRHDVVDAVIEYRQLAKLKSTYADGLLKVIAPDGRIHSSFNMTATATGRISSTEPNLQNIPVRQDLGSEIRRMFIPESLDWVLIDADYSQIELRILAHIAHDEAMISAFLSGEDFHTVTASKVFGVPVSEVTPAMRRNAKAVNFGIVYGISDFSLAADIGVTRAQARQYMDNYFEKYSGVRRYMKDIVERAKSDGFVTTIMGRRRYLPELKSSNFNIRSFGERVALNTPIQGSAADIIKLAMVRVYERFKAAKMRSRLILQVHDELIVEAPRDEAKAAEKILKEEMEAAASLSVPILADAASGDDWYDAKK